MSSTYFMEHFDETNRLIKKTNPDAIVQHYLQQHINPSEFFFLDIGCGPGIIDNSISNIFKGITIHCADISSERIQQAKQKTNQKNIYFTCADANELPYETNCFDFVFARFLFEYLKNPDRVISEMIRVCRSGGKLLIQDLDGQLLFHYPEYTDLSEQMNLVIRYLESHYGFDPFVGRKLYYLCASKGLINIHVSIEPYHLIYGKISETDSKNWQQKLTILLPAMEKALGSMQKAITLKNDCLKYLQHEDTLLYSTLFSVIAIKP